MNEQEYFQQFAGDILHTTGYFIFSGGSADYGTFNKDECEQVLKKMTTRYPGIEFVIRTSEVPENFFNWRYIHE